MSQGFQVDTSTENTHHTHHLYGIMIIMADCIWGFLEWGVSQNGWLIMEKSNLEMDGLGVYPYFRKPPLSGII